MHRARAAYSSFSGTAIDMSTAAVTAQCDEKKLDEKSRGVIGNLPAGSW
jgi:hypothetical protein